MRNALTVLTAAVVLVVACGKAPVTPVPAPGDRLYVAVSTKSGALVDIVDARSHATLGVLPLGTASADWKHYYAVRGGALQDIDPHSGATLHTLQLARAYDVPRIAVNGMTGGLSENGRWLVLETAPGGAQSHLLVVDTSFRNRPVPVDLDGAYEFDGMANDGEHLYLLHYLSGSDYEVRFFSVSTRALDPTVIVDKFDPSERMTGRRLATVVTPDGSMQMTVYAREKKGAFIHALSMDAPFSLCIDLPGAGWGTDLSVFHWTLVLSPDASMLYAINGELGIVTEIPLTGPDATSVVRTHALPKIAAQAGLVQPVAAKELGAGGAVVSPDGHTLVMARDTGIDWVDTASLKPRVHVLDLWRILSLGLSADGRTVYAVSDSGEIAVLSAGGRQVDMFDPKVGQPLALMRVEPAL